MTDKMQNISDPEARRFASQINELAERSLKLQEPQWTDFLEPPQREQAQAILSWVTGIRFNALGGYSTAERRRLVVYPDYYITDIIQPELAFIEVNVSSTVSLQHRDYLGAILNLGIKREKIGDILVSETGCQFILVPELLDFTLSNLERVGNCKVKSQEIESEQLNPPNIREKQIRTTVASLRLDAIAAFGFGESRTKMVREIKSEKVKVNWQMVNNPDFLLKAGDIISIRGRGRLIFQEQTGQSKKGRLGVLLVRYL